MSLDRLREQVCAANTALVRSGLVTLSFGNVSGVDRSAGIMLIKPSGVPYETLRPDDLVGIDLASGVAVEGAARPSSDTPTHLRLYRRYAEIGGVVHTHSTQASAWAQAGRPIPCLGTTHADHFRGPVPVTRADAPIRTGPDVRSRYRCRDHRDPGGAPARPTRDAGDPGSLPWAVHLGPGCGRGACERHRPRGGGDDGGADARCSTRTPDRSTTPSATVTSGASTGLAPTTARRVGRADRWTSDPTVRRS